VRQILLRVDRLCRWLTLAGIAAAALCQLAIMLMISLNVISGAVHAPIPVIEELASTMLAICIFSAIAYAQDQQEHIGVDILTGRLSPQIRRWFRVFSLSLCALFFLVLTWRASALALKSWEVRETAMALIPYPVYPFKVGVLVGLGIATVEFIRQLVWAVFSPEALDRMRVRSEPNARI
jgi:TRAP-type C4-dicarboxylate transport system permease small subunit